MARVNSENLYKNLPESPGVYLMKGERNRLLYVGKAANLRRRVSSYFTRPHDIKIERLVSRIKQVDFEATDTAIEALVLEAKYIKKAEPPFNVKDKDDKSFLFVDITREKYPRVLLSRGRGMIGPFTSATSIREALRIIRRIFPWSVHPPEKLGTYKRPCFDYELGLCPGVCARDVDRHEYLRNIRNVRLFFSGGKRRIISLLTGEMEIASHNTEYERAERIRRQIFALRHIHDVALISENEPVRDESSPYRMEGYDISNISGASAVGSMVVFNNGAPAKDEYRKFRIRTLSEPNDVGMLREVLARRFRRIGEKDSWPLPNLILIDGGVGQVNAARNTLSEFGLKIPVVGIAKGATRKNNRFIGKLPPEIRENDLIRLRNEAHRFAISYHKKVRKAGFFAN